MSRWALLAISACVFAAVWLLAATSPVPSEDGVSYLWMAQRFAAGDFRQGFAPVFPPGYPLLLAPWIALGGDAERVAAWCGAAALALTVVPLAAIARSLHPAAAGPAVVLYGSCALLLRVAAECYSEPPFLLLMACGTWCGARGRWWACGLCAGFAFWIRPEGLGLAAAFALASPRVAWRALLPAALLVPALAAWRAALGLGFDLLPLVAFHDGRDDLPERGNLVANVLSLPGPWFEAFGFAGLLVFLAPWRRTPFDRALRWQVVLQVGAICTFVVRRRFFLSCAIPVFAFAGAAMVRWPTAWRRGVLALAVGLGAVFAWNGRIDADRGVERELGAWLGARLRPQETVFADRPRILFFAGLPPGPPRHWTVEQLQGLLTVARPRFVVLTARNVAAVSQPWPEFTKCGGVAGWLLGTAAELPPGLGAAARQRNFLVCERR